jgi:hypothetical protein
MYILIDGEKAKKTVFNSFDEAREYVDDKYNDDEFEGIKLYELGQEYTVKKHSVSDKTIFHREIAE